MTDSDSVFQTFRRSSFHHLSTRTENSLEPKDLVAEDWGFVALQASVSVLNLMWTARGSLCRQHTNSIGLQSWGRLKTSQAAAFGIICTGLIFHRNRPRRNELL